MRDLESERKPRRVDSPLLVGPWERARIDKWDISAGGLDFFRAQDFAKAPRARFRFILAISLIS